MATIIDHPPVSTPADEWAASTTNALHSKSQLASVTAADSVQSEHANMNSYSVATTPGSEVPGAFPKTPSTEVPTVPNPETPRAAVDHVADAAPPKSTTELQETAKGYMSDMQGYLPDMQAALETAKGYFPQSIANVFRESCRVFLVTICRH